MTSATSERTFSVLRRLKNYLRSTMEQDRLNNCLLMHCNKSITDTLGNVKIAKRFACANDLSKGHFGKFEQGYVLGLVYDDPLSPPPPPTFQNGQPPLISVPKIAQILSSCNDLKGPSLLKGLGSVIKL